MGSLYRTVILSCFFLMYFLAFRVDNNYNRQSSGRFLRPQTFKQKNNHDYNFTKTRERKLLGAILRMDHFN